MGCAHEACRAQGRAELSERRGSLHSSWRPFVDRLESGAWALLLITKAGCHRNLKKI